ncbi:MAG: HAMP domain-containing protein, partial [Promicromonosporaceae bacterium]|nr:HAMP domain-containing protein [Promicromonosporaceae bacterium]
MARIPSLRWKLAFLVTVVAAVASALTWLGLRQYLGPTRTFPLVAIASVALTLLLERGITSPLREMTRATRAMAAGDYTQRVSVTGHDEVGQLGTAFNQMAGDLSSVDQARRDLIANVSHELRTPVAALQAELENMADGVTRPTPQTLQLALAQTERLGRLVTDMLDLSRLEAGAVDLHLASVRLGEFFSAALDAVAFVASTSGKGLTLRSETSS